MAQKSTKSLLPLAAPIPTHHQGRSPPLRVAATPPLATLLSAIIHCPTPPSSSPERGSMTAHLLFFLSSTKPPTHEYPSCLLRCPCPPSSSHACCPPCRPSVHVHRHMLATLQAASLSSFLHQAAFPWMTFVPPWLPLLAALMPALIEQATGPTHGCRPSAPSHYQSLAYSTTEATSISFPSLLETSPSDRRHRLAAMLPLLPPPKLTMPPRAPPRPSSLLLSTVVTFFFGTTLIHLLEPLPPLT